MLSKWLSQLKLAQIRGYDFTRVCSSWQPHCHFSEHQKLRRGIRQVDSHKSYATLGGLCVHCQASQADNANQGRRWPMKVGFHWSEKVLAMLLGVIPHHVTKASLYHLL